MGILNLLVKVVAALVLILSVNLASLANLDLKFVEDMAMPLSTKKL